MSITLRKKKHPTLRKPTEVYEQCRLDGFTDARNNNFNIERYPDGMQRRAYDFGREQWLYWKEKR